MPIPEYHVPVVAPVSRCLDADSAQRLLALQIDPETQDYIDLLSELANEGILTPLERSEYEALINASDLISILKLKARRNFGQLAG